MTVSAALFAAENISGCIPAGRCSGSGDLLQFQSLCLSQDILRQTCIKIKSFLTKKCVKITKAGKNTKQKIKKRKNMTAAVRVPKGRWQTTFSLDEILTTMLDF